jgi:hypothetical protein
VLHLHQVAQGTFTPKTPDMPGTHGRRPPEAARETRATDSLKTSEKRGFHEVDGALCRSCTAPASQRSVFALGLRDCGSSLLNPSMGRRRLASEARATRRGGGKSSRKPLKANDRRKTAPASVGSAVASAAARCARPGPTRGAARQYDEPSLCAYRHLPSTNSARTSSSG